MQYELIDKHEAASRTKLSDVTLKRYRLNGELIQGVHWEQINSRSIRYRSPLIEHWAQHRHDPAAHLAAIEAYECQNKAGTSKSRLTPA